MSGLRGLPRTLGPLVRSEMVLVIGLALAAGLFAAWSPSLVVQLAAIGALVEVLIAFAITRAGTVMNAAWPIVAWLYLLGPIGSAAALLSLDVSAGVVVLLAVTPFPVFAAAARPRILGALPQLLPIAALAVLALVSLAWSSNAGYGVSKLALWLTTCIVPAASIAVLARATSVSWRVIAAVGVTYVMVLILFGAATPSYPGRVTIFGANPIWVGRAAVVVAIVGTFGPFRLPVRLMLLLVGTIGAVLTGSAGPLVGLVAGILSGVAIHLRDRDWAGWRPVAAWSTLAGLAVITLGAVMLGLFDRVFDEAARDPNNLSRPAYFFGAIGLFLESPLIGSGFGAFASTGLDLYPHNMLAEIAAELGLLGLVALGAWLLVVARAMHRSPLLTALVVTTFVFAMFSGNIAGETEFWFFSALAVGAASATGWRRVRSPTRASLLPPDTAQAITR